MKINQYNIKTHFNTITNADKFDHYTVVICWLLAQFWVGNNIQDNNMWMFSFYNHCKIHKICQQSITEILVTFIFIVNRFITELIFINSPQIGKSIISTQDNLLYFTTVWVVSAKVSNIYSYCCFMLFWTLPNNNKQKYPVLKPLTNKGLAFSPHR